ncbi:activin receptor type-2A-like isoform X2 [Artemia franciscana]|uniref:Serine/threonine-protein kinase receptor n=1 Tax=Artemia franciscana TaxID=6661 RepID=A0AA88LDF7_ARTSF|nr:hypothetical protein QYM36_003341 [Artemia franciscana]
MYKGRHICILLLKVSIGFSSIKVAVGDEDYLYCVSEANGGNGNSSLQVFVDSIASKPSSENQRVDHCENSSNACFALWEYKLDEQSNYISTILRKGCWKPSDADECESDSCFGKLRPYRPGKSNLAFCCCKGNMCNLSFNFTVEPEEDNSPDVTVSLAESSRGMNIVLWFVGILVVMLGFAILIVMRMLCQRQKEVQSRLSNDSDECRSLVDCFDAKDLKIMEIIGHGRYGTVWRGAVAPDRDVAVKVFNQQSQNYFFNERDIYCLPLMDHPNIVVYLGCDERIGHNEFVEHRVFLNYHPIGCIQDYLRNNPLDWSVFCKMGQSVARGLSYLHTYIKKGDYLKPAVAHRDINSRNILVKSDLSLCICDMGFAMQIDGAHYVFSGEQQHAETSSLTDVGTLRYMAPEVLEGAVNLRECEAALKQVDVYALSLVLWELATRCFDLCVSSNKVSLYKMPFEAELGPHIDFERLQNLVCRLKARPLFPEFWRENNPAIRLLRETIEDCWDQDSEARLTAVCVEERFTEMTILWERTKDSDAATGDNTGNSSVITVDVSQNNDQDFLAKEFDKNFNKDYPWCPQVQPYHGTNPCLERNTLNKDNSEDLSISGNALISKSIQVYVPSVGRGLHHQQSVSSDTNNSNVVNRILNPISYVQNVVIEPKVLNTPKPDEPQDPSNMVSRLLGALTKKSSPRNHGEHLSVLNPRTSSLNTKDSSERSLQNVCVDRSTIIPCPISVASPTLVVHVPVNDLGRDEVVPLLEQAKINANIV